MTDSPQKQPSLISHLDKNVSSNWRPVTGLEGRPARMALGDQVVYWLLSLAGLAIAAVGIFICAEIHSGKIGGLLIGLGIGIFAIGPSQAARKGYRI